jgi:helicase
MERAILFNKYVRGALERLQSSFNPAHIETWLVRLLAQVVKIPRSEVAVLLLNTYAGYLETRRNSQWRAQMTHQIERLIQRMIGLGLIEVEADNASLSLLGRACGRSSLSFGSAMRLIEIIRSVPEHLLSGTNLMGVMQGLPAEEMGYTPLLQGTKEAVRVDQAIQRFGREIVTSLQRYAGDQLEFYGRCKRAAVLYDWISGRRLEEIENDYSTTPYRGRIEYGDIRRFADTTRFHLQSAANILAVLLLGKNPQAEIDAVLKQLEIGIPAKAIDLLRLPLTLTRGEYLALAARGMLNPAQLWAADKGSLIAILGKDRGQQLERFRPKKAAEASG